MKESFINELTEEFYSKNGHITIIMLVLGIFLIVGNIINLINLIFRKEKNGR